MAVLIMIGSHTLDSWTIPDERSRPAYVWANIVGGFGAPIFLFLAGAAIALGAQSRLTRGADRHEAAAAARKRAWQILGLAFLFRLQSWAISGGGMGQLLKVDILNVMGLSMLGAALAWGAGRGRWSRGLLLASLTVAVAVLTPLVRSATMLQGIPDPLEWYLRPSPGHTNFTLFPWSGFLFAGGALGVALDGAGVRGREARLVLALAVAGPAIAAAGYAASLLPPVYEQTAFWTSSPTFFFVRLGIVIAAVAAAYGWNAVVRGPSPLQRFGLASLFVYWIHVEIVYGVLSMPVHRRLTLEQAAAAYVAFSLLLFWIVERLPSAPRVAHLLQRVGLLPARAAVRSELRPIAQKL